MRYLRLTIAGLVTAAIALPFASPAMAADTTREAESMVVSPARAGSTHSDSSATGGTALRLWWNASASTNLSLPASIRVVVRAKGESCQGAPSMTVSIDGKAVSTTTVSATSWTDYTTVTTIPAGSRTLSIAFTNDYYRELQCDRNLLLDKFTVVAGNTTTTPPTTTTTTTTTPTPNPCAAPNFPDASCTGVPSGTTLTVVNGNMTITTAGAIVENKDVRGCIDVRAANVIIRKSRVSGCTGIGVIWSRSTNLLVEDTEILCRGVGGQTGLTPKNYTARRINLSRCDNGLWAESNVTVVDSYLHDPIPYDPATDPHTDTIQMANAPMNITIRHNRIYGGYINPSNFGTSAIITGGNGSNIIIDNNLLAGGGYTLYCPRAGNPITVTNNRFSRVFVSTVGGFGPWDSCLNENTFGNVYHETGQLLPGQ